MGKKTVDIDDGYMFDTLIMHFRKEKKNALTVVFL